MEIKQCCWVLNQMLKSGNYPLVVHSCYDHVINMMTDDQTMVSFIRGVSMQPLSMRVGDNDFDSLRVFKVGQKLILKKDGIYLGSVCFDSLFVHEIWWPFLQIQGLRDNPLMRYEKLARLILMIREQWPTKGLATYFTVTDPFLELALKNILKMHKALRENDYKRARALASHFVGLGFGLTPSGDDYLLGVLLSLRLKAGLNLEKNHNLDSLADYIIRLSKTQTTDVSRAMLEQGARGMVNEDYQRFLRVFYTSEPLTKDLFFEVIQHGSTSGLDFIMGVITAMDY